MSGSREYAGSLGSQVVKVFDLVVGRTGLRDAEARRAGFEPLTVAATADDHKAYYPGAQPIAMRWTGDPASGRLLGVQLVGQLGSEIAKRVDVAAAAIHSGLSVAEISDLDLTYTPHPSEVPGTRSRSAPKPGKRPDDPGAPVIAGALRTGLLATATAGFAITAAGA